MGMAMMSTNGEQDDRAKASHFAVCPFLKVYALAPFVLFSN